MQHLQPIVVGHELLQQAGLGGHVGAGGADVAAVAALPHQAARTAAALPPCFLFILRLPRNSCNMPDSLSHKNCVRSDKQAWLTIYHSSCHCDGLACWQNIALNAQQPGLTY